jgi:hypothetical protein
MGTDHLILGQLTDHITGETLPDTHDERIRQEIARFLTDKKRFMKSDIMPRRALTVDVDGKIGTVTADFIIEIDKRPGMAIIYGPGSVVSRQRPALSMARLLGDRIIPVAVITNGRDAVIMDSGSGKTMAEGMAGILSRNELQAMMDAAPGKALLPERREKEARILFAMEILTRRECETYECSTGV